MKFLTIILCFMLISCVMDLDPGFWDIEITDEMREQIQDIDDIESYVKKNIKYRDDMNIHKYQDYWQSPKETQLLMTGDCEDRCIYALAIAYKMFNKKGCFVCYSNKTNILEGHGTFEIGKNKYNKSNRYTIEIKRTYFDQIPYNLERW